MNRLLDIEIRELSDEDVSKINTMDNSFEIRAKIVPALKDGAFAFTIDEAEGLHFRTYPDDALDYTTYIKNPEKAVFLAYLQNEAVGQIILKKWWNGFPWVEDIRVDTKYRKRRIGGKLMDAAVNWAREKGYPGIMLETQDTNVPACLFYQKYGFVLGGADKILYHATVSSGETALFWYFIF